MIISGLLNTCIIGLCASSPGLQPPGPVVYGDNDNNYVVVDVGALSSKGTSIGNHLSDDGQVVGYMDDPYPVPTSAFHWSDGQLVDLGSSFGLSESTAAGVNHLGHVVGSGRTQENAPERAYLWRDGQLLELGTLPGTVFSAANDINSLGQIVGGSSGPRANGEAFLWDDGHMIGLGTLGAFFSVAAAINEQSQVAGTSLLPQRGQRAFLWENGVMQDLGTLNGEMSQATDLNEAGHVVGFSSRRQGYYHAFLWDGATMHDLGDLGRADSFAYGINDLDQIVGYGYDTAYTRSAFLYTEATGMQNLNELIPPNSGWHLTVAHDINNQGQITGYGELQGELHAFLLTPIDPMLDEPLPGQAGVTNELLATGLTPDGDVDLYFSLEDGLTAISGCPGVSLSMGKPVYFGRVTASEVGRATFSGTVRSSARGRYVLFQAVDLESCKVSPVLRYMFE